ncbi:ATP-binding protein [Fonticula alba]|uniref:ATP-binding protein n=1 Tax=Fonticula alba TaxID=691883 RepID=A0A058Z6L0_FONAL|nr:ATP-binding protein [Fonticula alba]KCV69761.1 ATP-binding protein [Fonticula alba]|eukprot:XP_009496326.1 ATP-binding protein [Fonticula alba]
MSAPTPKIAPARHTLLVLSGKGGVGKSSTSVLLARCLAAQGFRVGLLDVDLCGPSIPTMLGLTASSVRRSPAGWIPVFADEAQRLSVMSIGFILPGRDDPVIWRGPKKTAMIHQFLSEVSWGPLDFLIIDTPPGTSDEHLAVLEALTAASPEAAEAGARPYHIDGAVIVSTPQLVALDDARKEISFCRTVSIPVLGVIENMSVFTCPHCSTCTPVFATGGAERTAAALGCAFLGRLPLDPRLTRLLERGGDPFAPAAAPAPAPAPGQPADPLNGPLGEGTMTAISTTVGAILQSIGVAAPAAGQ